MSPWDEAMVAFRSGDLMAAEALLQRAVDAAEAEGGPDSGAFAEACFNLASFMAGVGDQRRGIAAMRRAAAARGEGDQGQRDRLTYGMNLGELLTRAGELAEAEAVLREGLRGREALYGLDHPGYAFGLEPLGDVLLAAGEIEEAAASFDRALEIFWEAGHPRVASVIPARALCIKHLEGEAALSFHHLEALPGEIFADATQQALRRAAHGPSRAALAMLQELEAWVSERLPGSLRDVYATISNVARAIEAHDARIEALVELEALAPAPAERVEVQLGLAMAYDDAGEHGEAERTYARAVAAADDLGSPQLLSQVRRNAGLFLAERGRRAEAEPLLTSAVQGAREGEAVDELGRALVALGIFRQHAGDLDAARELLEEGTIILPPEDHDALCAQSHLDAIERGGGCGCALLEG